MTWEQRAKAGVDAKHFQEALRRSPDVSVAEKALGRTAAEGLALKAGTERVQFDHTFN